MGFASIVGGLNAGYNLVVLFFLFMDLFKSDFTYLISLTPNEVNTVIQQIV